MSESSMTQDRVEIVIHANMPKGTLVRSAWVSIEAIKRADEKTLGSIIEECLTSYFVKILQEEGRKTL